MSKVLNLPHTEFSTLWILHVGIGLAAGYAWYHAFRWDLAAASLVGIFFLAMFQHALHVLSGASTTLRPEDFGGRRYLRMLQLVFLAFALAAAAYIAWYRPLALLGIIAGILLVLGYAHPRIHLEELWGIGWAIGMNTATYIVSGKLTLGPAILLAGIGYATVTALMVYRALTGDYDYGLIAWVWDEAKFGGIRKNELEKRIAIMVQKRKKMLARGIMAYIIAMILMIIGFALW